MESVECKFISSNGMNLGCFKSGTGPSLLLVHGTGADHFRWNRVVEFFTPHFTVYAMDRRGRGASAVEPQAFAIEREYEDIASILEALFAKTHEFPYVLAHSYGALCTLGATLITSHIKKMVLYEPPMPVKEMNLPFSSSFILKLQELLVQAKRENIVEAFLQIGGVSSEQVKHLKSGPGWQGRVDAAHTIVREVTAQASFSISPSSLALVQIPTLLLLGGESSAAMKAGTEWLHQVIPHRQIEILPGQSHVAMDTGRDFFVQTVLRFLTG